MSTSTQTVPGGFGGPAPRAGTAVWIAEPLELMLRGLAFLALLGVLGLIGWHIGLKAHSLTGFGVFYTVVVSSYVLSRYGLAAMYRQPRDAGLEPDVAIIVPAFNEGEAVLPPLRSCPGLDYPKEKLELAALNERS